MIKLFNIHHSSMYNFDCISNPIRDDIVTEFEESFAKYVGAKYACSFNSATSAIFLAMYRHQPGTVYLPSILPHVVCNSIIHTGNKIVFTDNIEWVGGSYTLCSFDNYKIIDSAHKVDRHQFKNEAQPQDLMIFSFYPTKPVSGCDGGMIVSDDKESIEWLRQATINGTASTSNGKRDILFPGWKMYMNSYQAVIALSNLNKLDSYKESLWRIRQFYNSALGYSNTSDHLYRINIQNNDKFLKHAKKQAIECGIHYNALHRNHIYATGLTDLPLSTRESKQTVSIPFHYNLTLKDLYAVCECVESYSRG